MLPNGTQAQTGTAAIIAGLAGYAAGQHWLGLGADTWGQIIGAAIVLGTAAWPVIATRVQALKNTVGKSGALVVTNAASAEAAPSPNVVAASQVTSAALSAVK